MKHYALVYQAGVANIFEMSPWEESETDHNLDNSVSCDKKRVLQHSFIACEWYCRGLRQAGKTVRVYWCNEAGDIQNSVWWHDNFCNAPFNDKFAKDFVKEND